MSFNDGAQLDPSQVEDRRGSGMGRGTKIGGGIGGGIVVLLLALFGINPNILGDLTGSGTQPPAVDGGSPGAGGIQECQSGADADKRLDCRITGTVNSLNAFWPGYLSDYNVQYPRPKTVIFSEATNTGCGAATSAVGPFYCPADTTAYFDPGFFDELVTRFGSSGGPLAQEYVVAHEFGHHIQNLLGTMGQVRTQQGPNSDAVRLELQADCYAGMWAKNATSTDTADGEPLLLDLTDEDIQQAIAAAKAVGDDRIQQQTTGRVNKEQWTHGSAAARVKWFQTGFSEGNLQACDTFAPATVE